MQTDAGEGENESGFGNDCYADEVAEELAHLESVEGEDVVPMPIIVVQPTSLANVHCPWPKGLKYKWCDWCNNHYRTQKGLDQHMRADHPKQDIKRIKDRELMTAAEKEDSDIVAERKCPYCPFKIYSNDRPERKTPLGDQMYYHVSTKHKEELKEKQEAERARRNQKKEEKRQKVKANMILCRICDFQADPLYWKEDMKRHMEEEHGNQADLLIRQFSDQVLFYSLNTRILQVLYYPGGRGQVCLHYVHELSFS